MYQLMGIDFKVLTASFLEAVRVLPMVVDCRPDLPRHQLLKLLWVDSRSIGRPSIVQNPMLVLAITEVLSSQGFLEPRHVRRETKPFLTEHFSIRINSEPEHTLINSQ